MRYFIDSLKQVRNEVSNASDVLLAARKKWADNLMEPEEVEDLFLETLRKIEYALFPYLDPENEEVEE